MNLHSYSGFFWDAVNNIIRNRLMSVATIITLIAGLFLCGLSAALTVNIFSITDTLASDFKLDIYIDQACTDEQTTAIGEQIKTIENVESITFVSKEQTLEETKARYSDTQIFEGIDDSDIFRDSYKVTLVSLEFSKQVTDAISQIQGVAKITDVNDEMNKFMEVSRKAQIIIIIISIILGMLSVLIITNTINMSIFARKKQINIMKYVGATDGYIRRPFIVEGLLMGIIAALFSFGGLYFLYNSFIEAAGTIGTNFGILNLRDTMIYVGSTVGIFGMILGIIGSIIAIKSHLKV
ncbi:MAG: permease-like cell division protein FtsX [Clostridia bacterium]|nr:permease-like cell division protein FtsX [Clostridia bacterium]